MLFDVNRESRNQAVPIEPSGRETHRLQRKQGLSDGILFSSDSD